MIDDKGGIIIAKSLYKTNCLKILNLASNDFSDITGKAFEDADGKFGKLEMIYLWNNKFTSKMQDKIVEYFLHDLKFIEW